MRRHPKPTEGCIWRGSAPDVAPAERRFLQTEVRLERHASAHARAKTKSFIVYVALDHPRRGKADAKDESAVGWLTPKAPRPGDLLPRPVSGTAVGAICPARETDSQLMPPNRSYGESVDHRRECLVMLGGLV